MSLERKDLYHFEYFEYGEAYYGSHNGFRYRIGVEPLENVHYKPQEEKDKHTLKAWVWKEPLGFDAAEEKTSADFAFNEDGLCEALNWINEKGPEMTTVSK